MVWPSDASRGAPACVMVRSIGAARGAVVVADGAENVRLPRLPELPDMRASAVTTVKESAATMARSASNQRWVRMVFPLWRSAGAPGSFVPPLYRYAEAPREGALHKAAGGHGL